MTEEQFRKIKMGMAVVLVAAMLLLSHRAAEYVTTGSGAVVIHRDKTGLSEEPGDKADRKLVVVIDAGHGSGNLRKVTKGKKIQKERQPLSLILQLNKL